MNPNYSICERGINDFNRVVVFNWYYSNEVDMMKWDDTTISCDRNVIAVFKIKPKISQ